MKTTLMLIDKHAFLLVAIMLLNTFSGNCMDCNYLFELHLKNYDGGVFIGQNVILSSKADSTIVFEQKSDESGKAVFSLPCNTIFNIKVANYTKILEIFTKDGGGSIRTLSYPANMVESEKSYAMNEQEISEIDRKAMKLPDTIYVTGSKMSTPLEIENYVTVNITLKDIDRKPLANEEIIITGVKRNKNIKIASNSNGKMLVYLPKGDKYFINFKHNKRYSNYDYTYTKGLATTDISLNYIGTKEIDRRKREEALRIAMEEKRLKEENERIKSECEKLKITREEWSFRKLLKENENFSDTVISSVLNRNKWFDKLVVCDLTGSMRPYTTELSIWYQLNYKKDNKLQFVFFNDGDGINDEKKIIGKTGGIYYSPSKGKDSLTSLIAKVSARGDGGDCAENNMEALIKGVKMAKPFKELVAIVDNKSPVKDIELLKDFKTPVHIVLCGENPGWILSDYLLIAWKTKGSIHTIEQDITDIAKMSEGQEIKIGNISYRIMGGEFVRLNNI